MILSLLALTASATQPAAPAPCGPSVTSVYEMVDYDGHRTIWAPGLFCDNKLTLMSMKDGELTVNPDGTGSFAGTAEVLQGGDCGNYAFDGTTWDVSYGIDPKALNTVDKDPNGNPWQLGLVVSGSMKDTATGNQEITFTNKPSSRLYGHQVGLGANPIDNDNEWGGAFWFDYSFAHPAGTTRTGHGDFNFDLTCNRTITGCPTSGDLGVEDFNVHVCHDFSASGSDSQGAMAVGGSATISGYGVASKSASNGIGLTVGATLTATSGQVYNGDAEAGSCSIDPSFNVLNGSQSCMVTGAGADCTDVCQTSNYIASLATNNCTVTPKKWGGVQVDVSGDPAVCDFDTDAIAAKFAEGWVWKGWINGITINGNNADTVIINVTGHEDIWGKTGSFNLNGVSANAIVWNFGCSNDICSTKTPWELSNVGIKGSLMAPDCDVEFKNGHIDGQYIVNDHTGGGQFHDFVFDGDICPPTPATTFKKGVGVRFRSFGNTGGDEVYLGVSDLGQAGNRTASNKTWSVPGSYDFTFTYDAVNDELTQTIDGGPNLTFSNVSTELANAAGNAPTCSNTDFNALEIVVADRDANSQVNLLDLEVDGNLLGDYLGNDDFSATVVNGSFDTGFTIEGTVELANGSFSNSQELSRVELLVGCLVP